MLVLAKPLQSFTDTLGSLMLPLHALIEEHQDPSARRRSSCLRDVHKQSFVQTVRLTGGLDTKTSDLNWSQALYSWKLPTRSFGFGFPGHPSHRESSTLPVHHFQVCPACLDGMVYSYLPLLELGLLMARAWQGSLEDIDSLTAFTCFILSIERSNFKCNPRALRLRP